MFFKKKDHSVKEKKRVVEICVDLIWHKPDGSYEVKELGWYFKDITKFDEYKRIVNQFSENWEKLYLVIQEDDDYMFFSVPKGFELYRSTCEIVQIEEE